MLKLVVVVAALLPAVPLARPQTTVPAAHLDPPATPTPAVQAPQPGSVEPHAPTAFHNFVFDTIGPYSIFMATATAAIHQATDNPPEWHQGAVALSKRFGSNMGITAAGNATRLGLGELFDQDTSFYRCRCKGVARRVEHAALSALIAHQRSNRHAVFSIPGLAAPYAATMTAVYAWYPARYGWKDAFRMGNYNLLGTVGGNITFEFLPDSVLRLMSRFHVNNRRIADP